MKHYYHIFTEQTDPDSGETTKVDIAKVSANQKNIANHLFKTLQKDTEDDPNVEVCMTDSTEFGADNPA